MKASICGAILLCLVPVTAFGNLVTTGLTLTADDDSRWFNLVSAAWAELGAVDERNPAYDGLFSIEAEPGYSGPWNQFAFNHTTFNPTQYVEIGAGADIFPNEPVFMGDFSVTWDSSSIAGVGSEVAPITGFTLAFDPDINHGWSGQWWSAGSVHAGSHVELQNGVVTGLFGGSDISVVLRILPDNGGGDFTYDGTFGVSGNNWSLLVDDANVLPFFGNARYVWDLHGSLSAVPEPSSGAALLVALGLATALRKRRR